MVVMAAVYAQWYSVSGGLGGQQTYTEERWPLVAQEDSAVESTVPDEAEVVSSNLTEGLPHYFPPTLYPMKENLQPTPTIERFEAKPLIAASVSGQLTEAEMRALLAEAGAPAEWIAPMLTIAWCESKYSPGAVGDSGNSLGLFQLWAGWFYGGEDPYDPLTNARVAVRVREIRGRFGGGGGWSCADLNGIP